MVAIDTPASGWGKVINPSNGAGVGYKDLPARNAPERGSFENVPLHPLQPRFYAARGPPGLVQSIKPAVEAAKAKSPKNLLAAAITENVVLNVKHLETAQPLLASFAQTGQLKIAGGVYDLANGKIGLLS